MPSTKSKTRFQCGIFGYTDPKEDPFADFGWVDEDGDTNSALNDSSAISQKAKGRFPGDYQQWLEEPGQLLGSEDKQRRSSQIIIPSPADMRYSQSASNLQQTDGIIQVGMQMPTDQYLQNEGIITINRNGLRPGIMKEDLLKSGESAKSVTKDDTEG